MCGTTQTKTVTAAATRTFSVGDNVRTPGGTNGVIVAQDGADSWIRTAINGRNLFRPTADLLAQLPKVGDTVITQKGNRAVIRAVEGDLAWIKTAKGKNVARRLDGLTAA